VWDPLSGWLRDPLSGSLWDPRGLVPGPARAGSRTRQFWDPPGMIMGPAVRLIVGPARAGCGTCPLSSMDPHVRSIVSTCGTCSQISLWDLVVRLKFANLNGHINSHMDMTRR
jgi:hypothetical protein